MSDEQWQVKLKHVPSGNLIVNKVCSDGEKEQYIAWFKNELDYASIANSNNYFTIHDVVKNDGRRLDIVLSKKLLEECVIEVLLVYAGG